MVVQSKQLRANAAKVHSGQVELKCCEECGKSLSPPRAVFVCNLMAVKYCLFMSVYPPIHTGVSCSWGCAQGKRDRGTSTAHRASQSQCGYGTLLSQIVDISVFKVRNEVTHFRLPC